MKLSPWTLSAAAALLAAPLAAAGPVLGSLEQGQVVARAGGMELGVEEAASLLAENPDIADDPGVVADMADLWVDYTLLAAAAYSGAAGLDLVLDRLVEPWAEVELVATFVDGEVRADTDFAEEELQAAWARESGNEVRMRHLLLRIPDGSTPAQRDSVGRMAESLRARAAGGEDFAALARRYSADASAAQGGDLGFIGAGDMEPELWHAALALEPGAVSPVVTTSEGLHVIRVEEKRSRPGPRPEEFEQAMAVDAARNAEARFVDSLTAAAEMRVEPGADEALRDMARNGGAARSHAVLATYRGGELTTGEAALVLRAMDASSREMTVDFEGGAEGMVRQLATREILLREARTRGVTLPPAALDSVRSGLRRMLGETLAQAGLHEQPALPAGEARDAAVRTRVRSLLRGMVLGEHPHLQRLGMLGSMLRADGAKIFPETFPRVIERMVALRRGRPRPPKPSGSPWARIP